MFLKKLALKNFRNIHKMELKISERKNYFYGENGQGKTNIIEAIFIAAYMKSFRVNKNINLIGKYNNFSEIQLLIENNNVEYKLDINIFKSKKEVYINNKRCSYYDLYKLIKVIIYFPEEVVYVTNFPIHRRNLVDRSIFTYNQDYIFIYKKYLRYLKQRNSYFKIKSNDDLWLESLIEYSNLIVSERLNYITRINKIIHFLSSDFNLNENYYIEYDNFNKNNYKEEILNKYEKNKIREVKLGYTLFGPHTDNINIKLNNNILSFYASEGQKKTFLLLYKYAQIIDFIENHKINPILIIDDISSELDKNRENIILKKIVHEKCQSFITTTSHVNDNESGFFEIYNGSVTST